MATGIMKPTVQSLQLPCINNFSGMKKYRATLSGGKTRRNIMKNFNQAS